MVNHKLSCAGGATRPKSGPSPVDRARPGSKHHVITEGGGIPLAASLTADNSNDITQLLPLVEAIPPVRGKRGHPRRRPDALYADRAYDSDKHRNELCAKGIDPRIAQRGNRPRLRAWRGQVGRRTRDRLVPRHATPPHPMGTPRRHPRGVPRPGFLRHLLPTHQNPLCRNSKDHRPGGGLPVQAHRPFAQLARVLPGGRHDDFPRRFTRSHLAWKSPDNRGNLKLRNSGSSRTDASSESPCVHPAREWRTPVGHGDGVSLFMASMRLLGRMSIQDRSM